MKRATAMTLINNITKTFRLGIVESFFFKSLQIFFLFEFLNRVVFLLLFVLSLSMCLSLHVVYMFVFSFMRHVIFRAQTACHGKHVGRNC